MPQGCIFEFVISQDEESTETTAPIAVRLQFAQNLIRDGPMNSIERMVGKGDGRIIYICKMGKEINGETFTGFEKKQDILMKGQDICTQVFEDEEDLIKLN